MKIARGTITSLALTGMLGLGLAGCSGDKEDTKTVVAADPKAALTSSVKELDGGNYAFDSKTPDTTAAGVVHLPSKSASMKVTTKTEGTEGTFDVVVVDPDRWIKMKMDMSSLTGNMEGVDLNDPAMAEVAKSIKQMQSMFDGSTWNHVDLTKVKGDAAKDLGIDAVKGDVVGLGELVGAVTTAQAGADKTTITGTIDPAKIGTEEGLFASSDVKKLAGTAVPYTATLDSEGRLSKIEMDMPKTGDTPAGKWNLAITGYGEQKAQAKPAGEITERPAQGYEMLNG